MWLWLTVSAAITAAVAALEGYIVDFGDTDSLRNAGILLFAFALVPAFLLSFIDFLKEPLPSCVQAFKPEDMFITLAFLHGIIFVVCITIIPYIHQQVKQ